MVGILNFGISLLALFSFASSYIFHFPLMQKQTRFHKFGNIYNHCNNDEKMFLCEADYHGYGAILNTGDYFHNVHFTKDNNTRIVFQLCFEESFEEVCKIYKREIVI